MRLCKFSTLSDPRPRVGEYSEAGVRPIGPVGASLEDLLHANDPLAVAKEWAATPSAMIANKDVALFPPIDRQEVWGAGVTYERSKVARVEESESGGSFYDKVYVAPRPELFFKATPSRCVGSGGAIRVRRDTRWCVPEPELALVISPTMRLVGYTVGNDVSARDIEGMNPLYLPQAKVYDACCGLGPAITLADAMPPISQVNIHLQIDRDGATLVKGSTSLSRMARKLEDLIDWLGRDNIFPTGVIMLTGTGIVPPDEFSLKEGDQIQISIDGIGTLANSVVQGPLIPFS
jgi:2-dehydro-3-deoxy-D-arabinonate dehydratase